MGVGLVMGIDAIVVCGRFCAGPFVYPLMQISLFSLIIVSSFRDSRVPHGSSYSSSL